MSWLFPPLTPSCNYHLTFRLNAVMFPLTPWHQASHLVVSLRGQKTRHGQALLDR